MAVRVVEIECQDAVKQTFCLRNLAVTKEAKMMERG